MKQINSILLEGYVSEILPNGFVLTSDDVRIDCMTDRLHLTECGYNVRCIGRLYSVEGKICIKIEAVVERNPERVALYAQEEMKL